MTVDRIRCGAGLAPVLALAGCLLPSPPPPPRYFAPREPPAATATASAVPATVGVRLVAVRSPVHLREQMVWRRSDVEYGFHDQLRWTEPPAQYVERALARELFTVQRMPREVAPGSPIVSADLLAFEEVLAPAHEARVEIAADVVDGRCLVLRRRFVATRSLADGDPASVVRALGDALEEVAHQAGEAIRDALEHPRRCS